MEDLLKVLYDIRKNPDIYFGGRKRIINMNRFIFGYVTGREGTDKEIKNSDNIFSYQNDNGFQNFVANKYQVFSPQAWYSIIEFQTSSDNEAFELFYKLLDEFIDNKQEGSYDVL